MAWARKGLEKKKNFVGVSAPFYQGVNVACKGIQQNSHQLATQTSL